MKPASSLSSSVLVSREFISSLLTNINNFQQEAEYLIHEDYYRTSSRLKESNDYLNDQAKPILNKLLTKI